MSWKKVKLADVTEYITDGDHQPAPKSETGIFFVKIKDIQNNKVAFDNALFVPQQYYDRLPKNRKAVNGDTLYTVVGSYGIPAFVNHDIPFCFERNIALLHPNSRVVPQYLYYAVKNPAFFEYANNIANGSAQKLIPLSKLASMEIVVPPLEIQKKIVVLLSAYDDLIENNQKQIKLLEEAAQRLYKEWFVDLHFPGYETTPITDGIPEGWKQGALNDVVKESGKKISKDRREGYTYYLPIDCLPKKSLGYLATNEIEFAESSLVAFEPGDIIFGAMRPYFHKVVVARDSGITRTTCFVLNAGNPAYWAFAVMLMFSSDTVDYATQVSVGTTMPYTRWKDFKSMPIIIPCEECVIAFGKEISPIITKINGLAEQIVLLQQARDRLLPKLMSGEIEV